MSIGVLDKDGNPQTIMTAQDVIDALNAIFGVVGTTPAANTALDRLKAIQTALALNHTDEAQLHTDIATTLLSSLATQTTAAAILAKLSADPATQTTLAALLAACNPVGKLSQPTAVADGAAVVPLFDTTGRQIVRPALRSAVSDQYTVITSSTAATIIVAADAANMNDLVGLILSNISATATEVALLNDDGTTVRSTFMVPAGETRGIVFDYPFKQTAINKAWKMATITSIASLKVTAQFAKSTV